MKILKLLNKILLFKILFSFLLFTNLFSNEPVDIWSINNNSNNENSIEQNNLEEPEGDSLIIQTLNNQSTTSIELDNKINVDEKNYLVGLFDPAEHDLTLNMWQLSDGEKILNIIEKLNKLNLSNDAKDLYNKLILTNALPPKNNLTIDEFLKLKSNWLIRVNDLNLIKEFLLKNSEKIDQDLVKYYLEQNLSNNNLNDACQILSNLESFDEDKYLAKFKVYCFIYKDQNEIAQMQFDLLKENGFKDKFFEKKFEYLMGYSNEIDATISEKNILDFHLSHKTNPNFSYIPKDTTNQLIWNYLRNNNLLISVDEVVIEDDAKVISIEKETHKGNYSESDLLNLYTRYKFNINQLISIEESYKLLPENQSRALLYQGYLLSKDDAYKIKILEILKNSFDKSEIGNALDKKLVEMLEEIDEKNIPSEYLEFYNYHLAEKKNQNKKIKINNKIIHQSKLVRYFENNMEVEKAEKELNKMLKKIKKNQKYYFSTKDLIVIEALISDGVQISEKNKEYFELDSANIPTDIQVMINDGEIAMILLRLVEIIGEDNLKDLGTESLYFIISTLNKLGIDKIRNDMILKTIPLKA